MIKSQILLLISHRPFFLVLSAVWTLMWGSVCFADCSRSVFLSENAQRFGEVNEAAFWKGRQALLNYCKCCAWIRSHMRRGRSNRRGVHTADDTNCLINVIWRWATGYFTVLCWIFFFFFSLVVLQVKSNLKIVQCLFLK